MTDKSSLSQSTSPGFGDQDRLTEMLASLEPVEVFMKKAFQLLVALALCPAPAAYAQDQAGVNVGERLPPPLRTLLIQEMHAILGASQQIYAALIQGQDDLVVTQAQAIHDSFILAQKMTEKDRHVLHESMPHEFLELDSGLHELSANLAEAARRGDQSAQRALFQEMTQACVNCHSRFASSRFPGLR